MNIASAVAAPEVLATAKAQRWDTTLTIATVDRILHHAHVITTEDTSMRLSEATAGRGVIPLT